MDDYRPPYPAAIPYARAAILTALFVLTIHAVANAPYWRLFTSGNLAIAAAVFFAACLLHRPTTTP